MMSSFPSSSSSSSFTTEPRSLTSSTLSPLTSKGSSLEHSSLFHSTKEDLPSSRFKTESSLSTSTSHSTLLHSSPAALAHAYATEAEHWTAKGHYSKAAQSHALASDQYALAMQVATDPEVISTLSLLHRTHLHKSNPTWLTPASSSSNYPPVHVNFNSILMKKKKKKNLATLSSSSSSSTTSFSSSSHVFPELDQSYFMLNVPSTSLSTTATKPMQQSIFETPSMNSITFWEMVDSFALHLSTLPPPPPPTTFTPTPSSTITTSKPPINGLVDPKVQDSYLMVQKLEEEEVVVEHEFKKHVSTSTFLSHPLEHEIEEFHSTSTPTKPLTTPFTTQEVYIQTDPFLVHDMPTSTHPTVTSMSSSSSSSSSTSTTTSLIMQLPETDALRDRVKELEAWVTKLIEIHSNETLSLRTEVSRLTEQLAHQTHPPTSLIHSTITNTTHQEKNPPPRI
ncbi:hypothetical protein HMI54_013644 [Coelomomyces lativittatus]|nr:hypothetical protein HMI56_001441 [Coelomomyces lativittatus]KAJ1514742.1 hypothetical protein HMI54_013644 [Coelomomyces lativittatus]KAJ1516263.1 hypothetical protein HMI55_002668 [Coelomomyces lativittatus]